jgi:hypothetical protein
MPRSHVDRLTREADAARPELGIRAVVVAEQRSRWVAAVQIAVFLGVVMLGAGSGLGRGPLAVALTAAAAGWCAAIVGRRATHLELLALGAGRAHVFDVARSPLTLRVGQYRGALRSDELTFVNGGSVNDEWQLLGRHVRVLRVHRHLLDQIAGPPPD